MARLAGRASSANRGLLRRKSFSAEVGGGADGAGQEAAAERGVRDESDAQLPQRRQDLGLEVPGPQRVLALQRGDRVHGVGAADGVGRGLAQPEESDLAGRDQLGHGPDGLLDRRVLVHPVLVVEVDVIDSEPLQTGVASGPDILRTSVDAQERAVLAADVAELGGQHHLIAAIRDRLADQPLVGERPVHVRRVQQRDAQVQGAVDGRRGLGLVRGAVELGHAHAAESEGGDGEGGGPGTERSGAESGVRCGGHAIQPAPWSALQVKGLKRALWARTGSVPRRCRSCD